MKKVFKLNFYIEGIYFSSLHPINIEALCLKYLAILTAWFFGRAVRRALARFPPPQRAAPRQGSSRAEVPPPHDLLRQPLCSRHGLALLPHVLLFNCDLRSSALHAWKAGDEPRGCARHRVTPVCVGNSSWYVWRRFGLWWWFICGFSTSSPCTARVDEVIRVRVTGLNLLHGPSEVI